MSTTEESALNLAPALAPGGFVGPQIDPHLDRHSALGLSADACLEMYAAMRRARAVDERMWVLNRAGLAAFVISGQGHEAAQVGTTFALRRGHDFMCPY